MRSYSLSSYTGIRAVFEVEYPAAQTPPQWLKQRERSSSNGFYGRLYFDVTGGEVPSALIIGPSPTSGENIGIRYLADYPYPTSDATTWTIPARDVDLLVLYAVWLALASLAREAASEVSPVMVTSARGDYDRAHAERMGRQPVMKLSAIPAPPAPTTEGVAA